jgi:hypothetical protein
MIIPWELFVSPVLRTKERSDLFEAEIVYLM